MAECHPVAFRWVMKAKTRPHEPGPGHPRRSAVHPHFGAGEHLLAAARRAATSSSSARSSTASSSGSTRSSTRRPTSSRPASGSSATTCSTTRTRPRADRRLHGRRGRGRRVQRVQPRAAGLRPDQVAVRQRADGQPAQARPDRGGRQGRPAAQQEGGPEQAVRRRSCKWEVPPPAKTDPALQRPEVRLADPAPALRPVHAGDWSKRSAARRARRSSRSPDAAVRERRPRPDDGHLLRGRLDAAHDRRADDPGRGHPAAAARQRRPAGRRHPRPARPRHHPGLDRHRHALQPAPRLPERRRAPSGTTTTPRPSTSRTEVNASSYWSGFPSVHRQPAARRGSATPPRRRTSSATTGCRRSSATTRTCRCSSRCRTGMVEGLVRHGPEPGRRRAERLVPAAGAGEARLAGRPRPVRDRDGQLLEGLAPRSRTAR